MSKLVKSALLASTILLASSVVLAGIPYVDGYYDVDEYKYEANILVDNAKNDRADEASPLEENIKQKVQSNSSNKKQEAIADGVTKKDVGRVIIKAREDKKDGDSKEEYTEYGGSQVVSGAEAAGATSYEVQEVQTNVQNRRKIIKNDSTNIKNKVKQNGSNPKPY